MGGLNSPLERQEKKEKLILKPHRSSGKQSNKINSNKVVVANRQLVKIQNRVWQGVSLCITHLYPPPVWSSAVLISSQLPPSNQSDHRKPVCNVPTYLGAVWRLLSVPLNSKLKLKSSWSGYYSYRRNIYIYIHTHIYRDSKTKE